MIDVTLEMVRGYHPLTGVNDPEITTHLSSAKRDFARVSFSDDLDQEEAICCQTIYYVAPLLWARGMANFANYETVFSSAGDIEKFQAVWKKRADAAVNRSVTSTPATGKIKWGSA